MAKVEAPNKDYNGPGPGDAVFENGVAEVENEAALNYYRSAGYKVSGKYESEPSEESVPDPRDVSHETVGTPLRDAAVDPEPSDFLAPLNAGDGNPHGLDVVSPEIHASGPSGIRPGEVFVEDTAKQEKREKAYADARLIQQTPVAEAVAKEVPDTEDRGPIGYSDPGSADAGRKNAEDAPAAAKKTAAKKTASKRPAKKS
jgi:hypothetical protein